MSWTGKFFQQFSIGQRFSLLNSVLLLVSLATVLIFNLWLLNRQSLDQERWRTFEVAQMLAEFSAVYVHELRINELEIALGNIKSSSAVEDAIIVDHSGMIIADGQRNQARILRYLENDPVISEVLRTKEKTFIETSSKLEIGYPIWFGSRDVGVVRLIVDLTSLNERMFKARRRSIGLAVIFFCVGLGMTFWWVKMLTRPLNKLNESMIAVQSGDMNSRVDVNGGKELVQVANSFNAMLQEINKKDKDIRRLAYFDSLTDLPNRLHFQKVLSDLTQEKPADGNRRTIALLLLDLDRFKLVNDSLGHPIGDALLKAASKRIRDIIHHGSDRNEHAPLRMAARLGGDEFVCLLENCEKDEAFEIAGVLVRELSKAYDIHNHEVKIGTSIGIARWPEDAASPQELLKAADIALYRAKDNGRGNAHIFDAQLRADFKRRSDIEAFLPDAIARSELFLVYQPIISLRDGSIFGFEALMRWENPHLGLVSPAEFIPIAEDSGLISELGKWGLKVSTARINQWRLQYNLPLVLTFNISARELSQADFTNTLLCILDATGLPPEALELEITERVALSDPELVRAQQQALGRLGVRFAIDDFGTGYSNLAQLCEIDFECLKIDRSFISNVNDSVSSRAIIHCVNELANDLQVATVAEGIETDAQLQAVKTLGIEYGQGFGISRPMPVDLTDQYLRCHPTGKKTELLPS